MLRRSEIDFARGEMTAEHLGTSRLLIKSGCRGELNLDNSKQRFHFYPPLASGIFSVENICPIRGAVRGLETAPPH